MTRLVQSQRSAPDLVPSGSYRAQLSQVRQFRNTHGERLSFEFILKSGAAIGSKVTHSNSIRFSESGKLAQTLQGILGNKFTKNDLLKSISFDTLIGKECMVMVSIAHNQSGLIFSKVESVFSLASDVSAMT